MAQVDTVNTVSKVRGGNTKTPLKKRIRARNWCITINNTITQGKIDIKNLGCNYIFQEEEGKQGTKHIQGFLIYKNPIAFETLKKKLPTAHIEKAKGTIKQNINYCSKSETAVGNVESNFDWENYGDKKLPWKPSKEEISEIAKELNERMMKEISNSDWDDILGNSTNYLSRD